ncbi:MAG: hypothetical protein Q8P20_04115 [bacterium]|nr:hypothetical protein [bacterium]
MVISEKRREESRMQKLIIALSISSFAMLLIVVGLSWYVFDYSSKINKSNNDGAVAQVLMIEDAGGEVKDIKEKSEERFTKTPEDLSVEEVVEMVNRHMLLSDGEITVAGITNIEGLKTNYPNLFQYAKNGDKLLFYQLGIIIYDPVLDKIVDVMRRLPDGTFIPSGPFEEN